jgi:hypothetical protein
MRFPHGDDDLSGMEITLPAGYPVTVATDTRLRDLVHDAAADVSAAPGIYAAMRVVVEQVATRLGWAVGHAWVVDDVCAWRSAGVWYDTDPDSYTDLGVASLEAPPGLARGHLALALHLGVPEWTNGLEVGGTRAAIAMWAGLRGAVAAPVFVDGEVVALMEWFLTDDRCPSGETFDALGELAALAGQAAARDAVVPSGR